MRPVVDADAGEGCRDELRDRVRHPGGHDVVVTGLSVSHPHHRVDVFRRPAPIAACVKIAEHEPVGDPRRSPRPST